MNTALRTAAAILPLALACLAVATSSCRTDSGPNAELSDPACAECPVCKAEGDLACLKVHVRSDTPCSCHCGCTYYFCSEDCKKQFDRAPEKYVGH
jgi:YHS domain-containing protein